MCNSFVKLWIHSPHTDLQYSSSKTMNLDNGRWCWCMCVFLSGLVFATVARSEAGEGRSFSLQELLVGAVSCRALAIVDQRLQGTCAHPSSHAANHRKRISCCIVIVGSVNDCRAAGTACLFKTRYPTFANIVIKSLWTRPNTETFVFEFSTKLTPNCGKRWGGGGHPYNSTPMNSQVEGRSESLDKELSIPDK